MQKWKMFSPLWGKKKKEKQASTIRRRKENTENTLA